MKYEYPLIRIHLYQLIFYSLYVFLASIYYYGLINMGVFQESKLFSWFPFLLPAALTPLIYFMGRAYYFIAGVGWSLKVKMVFIFLALALPVFTFVQAFTPKAPFFAYVMVVVFLVQVWCYVVIIANYKKIDEPLRKFVAKLLFILPFYSIPIGIMDNWVMQGQLKEGQVPFGIMGQPLVYFLNNMMSLVVLLKARSLMGEQGGMIPRTFLLQYPLTSREQEILELLDKGLSNKEIASKLFISPSTARNHLSAIFEKTSTSSRAKLISLIQTFR